MQLHSSLFPKNLILSGSLVAMSLLTTGCGGVNSILTAVTMNTFTDANNDSNVQVAAIVNTGALQFPSTTVPIIDPKNPSKPLGSFSLLSVAGTTLNEFQMTLDLNRALKSNIIANPTLPNGNPLPVAGLGSIISFNAGLGNSQVYLGWSATTKIIGFAAAIKEFDVIAQYVPGANLFLNFTLGATTGLAGVFTSTQSAHSGIGLFFNASNLPLPASVSSLSVASVESVSPSSNNLKLVAQHPSAQDEATIDQQIMLLGQQNLTVHLK